MDPKDAVRRLLLARQRLHERALLRQKRSRQRFRICTGGINSRMTSPAPGKTVNKVYFKTRVSQINDFLHEVRCRPARVDAPLPTVDESFRTCRHCRTCSPYPIRAGDVIYKILFLSHDIFPCGFIVTQGKYTYMDF